MSTLPAEAALMALVREAAVEASTSRGMAAKVGLPASTSWLTVAACSPQAADTAHTASNNKRRFKLEVMNISMNGQLPGREIRPVSCLRVCRRSCYRDTTSPPVFPGLGGFWLA